MRKPLPIALLGLFLLSAIPQEFPLQYLEDALCISGDPAQEIYLHRPRDFVMGNGDTLYVLDTGDSDIKVFRATGEYLFTFSREGHGPGELSRPRAIDFRNNTIYVATSDPMQIIEFRTTGQYLRSYRLNQNPMDLVVSPTHAYVSLFSPTSTVLEVPLSRPDAQRPILTNEFTDYLSSLMETEARMSMGRCFLALTSEKLIVANSGISLVAIVDLEDEQRAVSIIDPTSTLIDEQWDHNAREFHPNTPRPIRGKVQSSMFNSVSAWSDTEVLLEIRTGSRETFRSIAAVFDMTTGFEVGPRITGPGSSYSNFKFIREDRIGWINSEEASIDIFDWNTR
ncbi:6-bladed beta-propeller [Gemmatimonadota bacterium]